LDQQALDQQALDQQALDQRVADVAPKAVTSARPVARPVAKGSRTSPLGVWRQAIGEHKGENLLAKTQQQLADNREKVDYYQTEVSEAEALVKEAAVKVESDPTSTRARSREQTEMNKAARVLKERKSQLANWETRVAFLENKVSNLQAAES
jgi:hypothetical protein